jgi:hypothetical protein
LDLAFVAARHGQAAAVELVDRFARSSRGTPRLLGRWWRLQLGTASMLACDPANLADMTYQVLERSIGLNHQFAHRLLEAADIREDRACEDAVAPANVTRLVPRKHG